MRPRTAWISSTEFESLRIWMASARPWWTSRFSCVIKADRRVKRVLRIGTASATANSPDINATILILIFKLQDHLRNETCMVANSAPLINPCRMFRRTSRSWAQTRLRSDPKRWDNKYFPWKNCRLINIKPWTTIKIMAVGAAPPTPDNNWTNAEKSSPLGGLLRGRLQER